MYWSEIHNVVPNTATDVLNEVLWNNMFILIDGKTICYKDWHAKGIVKVTHIVDDNGNTYTLNALQQKYGIKADHMKYNSIISSIPRVWKTMIKNVDTTKVCIHEEACVYLCKINKSINKLKCRDVYWHLVDKKYVTPSCIKKWQDNYVNVHFEWDFLRC